MSEPTSQLVRASKLDHAASVGIVVHNADFILAFHSTLPVVKNRGLTPEANLISVANISISPYVAKQLMRQLQQAVEEFERATGSTIPDLGQISTSNTEPE